MTCPIRISTKKKVVRGSYKDTKASIRFKVSQDLKSSIYMEVPWCLHKLTKKIDGKINVWTCDYEIDQTANMSLLFIITIRPVLDLIYPFAFDHKLAWWM